MLERGEQKPPTPREAGGFTVGRRIGSGSFGDVFEGRRGLQRVAIKLERRKEEVSTGSRPRRRKSHLRREFKLYRRLRGGRGIPKVYWYGKAGKHYRGMALELLGESLEDLFKTRKKSFSLKTVLMLADQMIERLQYTHSQGILHCDVKPNNFLVGTGKNKARVYLVDFGLSRSYLDSETGQHIPYRDGKSGGLTGTARYSSIANHQDIELARRDDLEGLGYVLVRMLRGTLPWQGQKAATKQLRNDAIKASKLSCSLEDVCQGCPPELATFIDVCRRLSFDERPDYEALRRLMRCALGNAGHKDDGAFDWCPKTAAVASSSASTSASAPSALGSACGGAGMAQDGSEDSRSEDSRGLGTKRQCNVDVSVDARGGDVRKRCRATT